MSEQKTPSGIIVVGGDKEAAALRVRLVLAMIESAAVSVHEIPKVADKLIEYINGDTK